MKLYCNIHFEGEAEVFYHCSLSHCSSNHNFRSDGPCGFFSVICSKPLCHLHAQRLRGLTERPKEIKVNPKQSSDSMHLSLVPLPWCPTASVFPSLRLSSWSTDGKASSLHLSCHLPPSCGRNSPAMQLISSEPPIRLERIYTVSTDLPAATKS